MGLLLRSLIALSALAVVVAPLPVRAQINAVDPDAKARPKPKAQQPPPDDEPLAPTYGEPDEGDAPPPKKTNLNAVDPDAKPRAAPKRADTEEDDAPPPPPPPKKKGAAKQPEPPPEPAMPKVPPIVVTKAGDAELEAAWEAWRRADASKDHKAEAAARRELKDKMVEVGATAMEPYAMGFIRASRAHEAAQDATGAIELAHAAIELAPELPAAHFGLARAYFDSDPANIGRWVQAFQVAAVKGVKDPRYLRAVIADFGSGLLYALVATAIAVTAVLFLRKARYFLYDVHWFFPRVVARWQSFAVGLLLVLSPLVFRMGVAPTLLVLFAATALYMTVAERAVVAVFIGLLGLVPLAAGELVRVTAFAGTPAEQVWQVEAGGPGAEAPARELTRLVSLGQASFVEQAALGSFELRRGKVDLAREHLREALRKQPNEPRASNNLAVAEILLGDLENPRTRLPDAAKADPSFAAPLFNHWRLSQRRHATFGDMAAAEVDQGNSSAAEAKVRDPSLGSRPEPPPDRLLANELLIVAPMDRDLVLELAKVPDADQRVRSQFIQAVLGDVPAWLAPFYPALFALLLFGFGFLAMNLEAARACNKCGRPVSRREDRELSKASQMCSQCINVFARKGVVPPSLKVRKQVEVARYQQTLGRASYLFGLLCSGMGHVFSGLPVRGAIYGFLFLFSVVMLIQRDGVLRVLYEGPPMLMKLLPIGVILVLVYLLSLRGLFRRQP